MKRLCPKVDRLRVSLSILMFGTAGGVLGYTILPESVLLTSALVVYIATGIIMLETINKYRSCIGLDGDSVWLMRSMPNLSWGLFTTLTYICGVFGIIISIVGFQERWMLLVPFAAITCLVGQAWYHRRMAGLDCIPFAALRTVDVVERRTGSRVRLRMKDGTDIVLPAVDKPDVLAAIIASGLIPERFPRPDGGHGQTGDRP